MEPVPPSCPGTACSAWGRFRVEIASAAAHPVVAALRDPRPVARRLASPYCSTRGRGPRRAKRGDLAGAPRSAQSYGVRVAQPALRASFLAAARTMRATAERMEAILAKNSLSDDEVIERIGADVDVFCAAMRTLDRELEPYR